jgi:hypothetical protein
LLGENNMSETESARQDTGARENGKQATLPDIPPPYDAGKLSKPEANILGVGLLALFFVLLWLFLRTWSLSDLSLDRNVRQAAAGANSAARNPADGIAGSATTAPAPATDSVAKINPGDNDGRGLLALVMVSGALGAWFYAASKYFIFRAKRGLDRSWVWWYLLMPPIGSVLALTFYLLLVGGLLTAGSGTVSKPGAVALSLLVGMFARKATEKLNEVFSTLFAVKEDPETNGSGQGTSGAASGSGAPAKGADGSHGKPST